MAHELHVGPGDGEDPGRAPRGGGHRADRRAAPIVGVRVLDDRVPGEEGREVGAHPDGPHSRPASAVGDAERLVQVDVRNVGPEIGRPHDAEERVQVRSVHVDLPALLVDDVADLADGCLENSVRGGIGHHQSGEPVPGRLGLGAQILDVHVAVGVAPHHHDLHPRHVCARGVRAVGGGGDEADVSGPLSPALVVPADDEKPRVLALRPGVGLERHPRERGALAEHELEVPDELSVPLGLVGRRERMNAREPLERHREHLGRRVQLHRARTERNHRAVEGDVPGREPAEIPQHLGLAVVTVKHRVVEDGVGATHGAGETGAG